MWGDWRGRGLQQPQVEAPCGACGEQVLDRHRLAFAGGIAHTECAAKTMQGASDRGEDWFRVAIEGGDGPSRRRTYRLTEIVQRIYQGCAGATE